MAAGRRVARRPSCVGLWPLRPRSSHTDHGPFRPPYFHPGLLQRPSVRRRDGAAPPRRGPAKARGRAPTVPVATVSAPTVSAAPVPAATVPAAPRVGAEVGMGLSASVAMLNHRCDLNGLGPRCKRRPSTGECHPSGPVHPWHGPSSRRWYMPRRAPGGLGPLAPLVTPKRRGDLPGRPATCLPLGGSSSMRPSHGRRSHPFAERSGCLVVRALRPIRPGEELCLSYVETSLPTAERKAHLLAHFGFECGCTRCAKE